MYIWIFQIRKKWQKMGFEHWLIYSDYTLDNSLTVTHAKLNGSGISYPQQSYYGYLSVCNR